MLRATGPSRLVAFLALSTGLLAVLQPATTFAVPGPPNTTITFNDATDSLSISTSGNGPSTIDSSCTGETCSITVLDPAAASGSSFNGTQLPLYILEPGSSIISDILDVPDGHQSDLSGLTGGYVVQFTSDDDETLGLGTFLLGNSIVEDGTVQNGFMIVWENSAGAVVDTATIQFQSDLDSSGPTGVPEPMSLAMFGAGLLGLAGLRRRWKANHPA